MNQWPKYNHDLWTSNQNIVIYDWMNNHDLWIMIYEPVTKILLWPMIECIIMIYEPITKILSWSTNEWSKYNHDLWTNNQNIVTCESMIKTKSWPENQQLITFTTMVITIKEWINDQTMIIPCEWTDSYNHFLYL